MERLTKKGEVNTLNHMVKYTERLDSTFGALAHPTRRAILVTLLAGRASISELAKPHRMSLPAVMKHAAEVFGVHPMGHSLSTKRYPTSISALR